MTRDRFNGAISRSEELNNQIVMGEEIILLTYWLVARIFLCCHVISYQRTGGVRKQLHII